MVAPLKVGVAGLGTVGAVVVAPDRARSATRWPRAAAGRSRSSRSARARAARIAASTCKKLRWVADPVELARDPGIDVFVELIGGDGNPAKAAVEAALTPANRWSPPTRRCSREHGVKLAALAEKHSVALNFEAAVGGAIPIVKTLARGARRQCGRRASTASSTAPAITS